MFGTQFGFLVDRPFFSGLQKHGAFRVTISVTGVVGHHGIRRQATELCDLFWLASRERFSPVHTLEQGIKETRVDINKEDVGEWWNRTIYVGTNYQYSSKAVT
jgi:hypothetical protein